MASVKHGGPAFPNEFLQADCQGMTLRDYFAANAMQALIMARTTLPEDNQGSFAHGELMCFTDADGGELSWAETLASDAYAIARAMLEVR